MERADFHGLYERHARDVYRFVLFLTGREDSAEDVTAEVFLRAWAGVDAIRHESARVYLIAIARNLVRDRARRGGRETAISNELEWRGASGETWVEFTRTMEAVQALPEQLRSPLSMTAIGGMSYEETARELGLTVSTVKIRVFRARQRLAERLERKETGA